MLVYGLLLIGGGIGVLVYFRRDLGIRPGRPTAALRRLADPPGGDRSGPGPAAWLPGRWLLHRWLRHAPEAIGLTVEPDRPARQPVRRPRPAIGRAPVPRPARATGRAAVPPPDPAGPGGAGPEPASPDRDE